MLLRLSGIDTYYGQIHILSGLDMEVGEGELVCLLGGNASGKSTTLKTILGIVEPRNGAVEFAGENVTERNTSYRIRLGMAIVPENRRLFAPMTVRENLEMGAYLRGRAAKEDFDRVYTLFPLLHERRNQLAGTMSGGEQQMVAMGRALMSRPKLLLMDEPSMGLAPILVERNFEIIKEVHEAGVSILVVEQNANISLSIADRGYVLSTGPRRAHGPGERAARARRPARRRTLAGRGTVLGKGCQAPLRVVEGRRRRISAGEQLAQADARAPRPRSGRPFHFRRYTSGMVERSPVRRTEREEERVRLRGTHRVLVPFTATHVTSTALNLGPAAERGDSLVRGGGARAAAPGRAAARPHPAPLPDLPQPHLHQLLLAGGAFGLGARGVRALPRGLGRARRAVGLLGGEIRGRAQRLRRPGQRGRRRGRGHDLRLGRPERDRDGPALRAPLEDRHDRLGVPHGRTDLARAGAPRRARRPHRGRRGRDAPLERFEREIDEDTAIVSVTHVCYRNGARVDVAEVARIAHERGALVVLDAYQSAGSLPLDVRELDVDFLAAGVLKYLLGSAGLAFLYARREVVERVWPTATGWFADKNIFEMDHRDYSPAPTASRFQSGTPPIPAIYAGVAGIELMQEIGVADTRRHVNALNARMIEGLDELGAQIATPRRPKRRGALDLRPFDGRAGARARARAGGDRHVGPRRKPAHLRARVQLRRRRGRAAGGARAAQEAPGVVALTRPRTAGLRSP